MKALDKFLQNWRIAKAAAILNKPALVLDIGTGNGALFAKLPHLSGYGIDVSDKPKSFPENAQYLQGRFPSVKGLQKLFGQFDAVVLLAVMEHVPEGQKEFFVKELYRALKTGGVAILTIPSPLVDHILVILKFLRLIDGIADEEHHGFDVQQTVPLFEKAGFKLIKKSRFQMGLNNFFVFKKD